MYHGYLYPWLYEWYHQAVAGSWGVSQYMLWLSGGWPPVSWCDGMWEMIQLGHHYATTSSIHGSLGIMLTFMHCSNLGTSRLVLSPENIFFMVGVLVVYYDLKWL